MERAKNRQLCCLHCKSEMNLGFFRRYHDANSRACILANPDARADYCVANARYYTGWDLWTPDKEERLRSILRLEHAKALAKQQRREALAESA